jgi:hypothetical protein
VPYVRTVKTASGATAVQIVYSSHRGSRDIEHLGSAHNDAQVELLKVAARQRLAAGQGELDLDLAGTPGGPLPITSSRMGHLLDALAHGYQVLGFDGAAGFSAVKEMYLDAFAEVFAAGGLNVVVFDNRCFGASDGEPRQEIDPWVQVRDYRHAITYASTLPEVDPRRIGIWAAATPAAMSWWSPRSTAGSRRSSARCR